MDVWMTLCINATSKYQKLNANKSTNTTSVSVRDSVRDSFVCLILLSSGWMSSLQKCHRQFDFTLSSAAFWLVVFVRFLFVSGLTCFMQITLLDTVVKMFNHLLENTPRIILCSSVCVLCCVHPVKLHHLLSQLASEDRCILFARWCVELLNFSKMAAHSGN